MAYAFIAYFSEFSCGVNFSQHLNNTWAMPCLYRCLTTFNFLSCHWIWGLLNLFIWQFHSWVSVWIKEKHKYTCVSHINQQDSWNLGIGVSMLQSLNGQPYDILIIKSNHDGHSALVMIHVTTCDWLCYMLHIMHQLFTLPCLYKYSYH